MLYNEVLSIAFGIEASSSMNNASATQIASSRSQSKENDVLMNWTMRKKAESRLFEILVNAIHAECSDSSLPVPPTPPPAPSLPKSLDPEFKMESSCKGKFRALHWDPLNGSLKGTVWELVQDMNNSTYIDKDELYRLFSKKSSSNAKSKRVSFLTTCLKKEKVRHRLPDPKHAQNLEIMLRRLPSIPQIIFALKHLDNSILSSEMLEILIQNLPTEEDFEHIKFLTRPLTEENSESSVLLVHALSGVSKWKERLNVWKFVLDFEDRFSEVKNGLSRFSSSLVRLMNLESLHRILAIVLNCGNTMNKGNAKGKFKGFRIDLLVKLHNTKCNSVESGSLLDFVTGQIILNFPEALEFPVEMKELLRDSSRVSLESLCTETKNLSFELNNHLKQAELVEKEKRKADDAFSCMVSRLRKYQIELGMLTSNLIHAQDLVVRVLSHFGLNLESAEKLFKDIYPLESHRKAKGTDRDASDSSMEWGENDLVEVNQLFIRALRSKLAHEENETDRNLQNERMQNVQMARQKFSLLVKVLSKDIDQLKNRTQPMENDRKDSWEIMSSHVKNLLRLLSDFSEQFKNSSNRLKARKIRSIKAQSSIEVSDLVSKGITA